MPTHRSVERLQLELVAMGAIQALDEVQASVVEAGVVGGVEVEVGVQVVLGVSLLLLLVVSLEPSSVQLEVPLSDARVRRLKKCDDVLEVDDPHRLSGKHLEERWSHFQASVAAPGTGVDDLSGGTFFPVRETVRADCGRVAVHLLVQRNAEQKSNKESSAESGTCSRMRKTILSA